MLYEIRTSLVRPGAVPELERRFAARLSERERFSPLGAYWHTEIGTMNQIVQVWPYRDLGDRERVHAVLPAHLDRPPTDLELTIAEQVEIWAPAPFMGPLEPHDDGAIFEMRTYAFRPGTLARVLEVWARGVPRRSELSPLVACWTPLIGTLDRLCHVWAYRSLDERARLRKEALALPDWPPPTREWRIGEEVRILVAAPFSPIR